MPRVSRIARATARVDLTHPPALDGGYEPPARREVLLHRRRVRRDGQGAQRARGCANRARRPVRAVPAERVRETPDGATVPPTSPRSRVSPPNSSRRTASPSPRRWVNSAPRSRSTPCSSARTSARTCSGSASRTGRISKACWTSRVCGGCGTRSTTRGASSDRTTSYACFSAWTWARSTTPPWTLSSPSDSSTTGTTTNPSQDGAGKQALEEAKQRLLDTPPEPSFAKLNPSFEGCCMGNRKTCTCGAPFFG